MKRRNYFIDDETIKRLEDTRKDFGITSVAAFIRYIIAMFFKDLDNKTKHRKL